MCVCVCWQELLFVFLALYVRKLLPASPLRWAVSLAGDLGKNLWRVPSGPEKVEGWDLKCVIRNVK